MDVGEIIPDRHGLDNTPILKRRDSHSIIITSFRKLGIDKPANLVCYYVTRYIVEHNSLEVALVNNALSDLGRFSEPAARRRLSHSHRDRRAGHHLRLPHHFLWSWPDNRTCRAIGWGGIGCLRRLVHHRLGVDRLHLLVSPTENCTAWACDHLNEFINQKIQNPKGFGFFDSIYSLRLSARQSTVP